VTTSLESGDRASFIARLAGGLVESPPINLAHPLPGPLVDGIPTVVSAKLDPDDLIGSFCRNATELACTVHRITGGQIDTTLAEIVRRHRITSAVVSTQTEAETAIDALRHMGIPTESIAKSSSASATMGLTVADAAIATTGSVVQRSDTVGGRTASLLPPVFCCIVPAERIVATLAEVLAALDPGAMPSNVMLVTGPSRSGDIESVIVRGVHGPVAVELVVVETH
jgi:L-lactate utilization protein LutC